MKILELIKTEGQDWSFILSLANNKESWESLGGLFLDESKLRKCHKLIEKIYESLGDEVYDPGYDMREISDEIQYFDHQLKILNKLLDDRRHDDLVEKTLHKIISNELPKIREGYLRLERIIDKKYRIQDTDHAPQ